MTEKRCTNCRKSQPLSEFNVNTRTVDGLQCWCKDCKQKSRLRHINTNKATKERWRATQRKYWGDMKIKRPEKYAYAKKRASLNKYKITVEQYDALVESQKYLCAICGKPPDGKGNKLVVPFCVDHCHATHKIRGLVHSKCNLILGLADDDPGILLAAAQYLERHKVPAV